MVGRTQDIGSIKLIDGGIRPGSGCGKVFPLVGTVSIAAIVTDTARTPTALGLVHKMALTAAQAIDSAVRELATLIDNYHYSA
jgi:hypothetical protein